MTKLRHFAPVIFRPRSRSHLCAWCGQPSGSGSLLGFPGKPALPATCEICCIQAGLLWQHHRTQRVESRDLVTRVVALAARRRWSRARSGQLMPPELAASYEFLLIGEELPSRDLASPADQNLNQRALEAEALASLAGAGVRSWPGALIPLYLGRDLDGSLCRVYLARAWAPGAGSEHEGSTVEGQPSWVPWPLTRGLGAGTSGLGPVLDEAWSAAVAGAAGVEPCRQLGEAAVRYLELRDALRRDPRTDASLMPAYQQGMTDDERQLTGEIASRQDDEPAVENEEVDERGEADVEEDEGEGEGGDEGEGDGRDGFVSPSREEEEVERDDEGEPPEGFAR